MLPVQAVTGGPGNRSGGRRPPVHFLIAGISDGASQNAGVFQCGDQDGLFTVDSVFDHVEDLERFRDELVAEIEIAVLQPFCMVLFELLPHRLLPVEEPPRHGFELGILMLCLHVQKESRAGETGKLTAAEGFLRPRSKLVASVSPGVDVLFWGTELVAPQKIPAGGWHRS